MWILNFRVEIRKPDEVYATLQPKTHSPAVWMLGTLARLRARSSIIYTEKTILLEIVSSLCLPGDDLLSQDPAVQVSSALEVLTSVFEMGTGGTPPA